AEARTISPSVAVHESRCLFVCLKAAPVQPALIGRIGMGAPEDLPDVPTVNGYQMLILLGENRGLNSACKSLIRNAARPLDADASNPAVLNPPLQLAQHKLANDVHAGVAVV